MLVAPKKMHRRLAMRGVRACGRPFEKSIGTYTNSTKGVIPMRKGLIATLAVLLVLGLVLGISAEQAPSGGSQQMGPQGPMGPGMGMGPGMMGQMGGQEMMGPGMGMMGMGRGMGMMGPMIGSPEIMGTMMSIHGEVMSLMGQMMQKYGRAMETMTPELQQQVQKEMLERMGDILAKHGTALRERAKAGGK